MLPASTELPWLTRCVRRRKIVSTSGRFSSTSSPDAMLPLTAGAGFIGVKYYSFVFAKVIRGEIIDVGESYRGQVRRRPWILFRPILRFPFPFIGFEGWKRSMRKLYWLFDNYRITGALFHVPPAEEMPRQAALVDSAGRAP